MRRNEKFVRMLARNMTAMYMMAHPEFKRVLTADERREQYADRYARAIMRLTA